MTTRTLFRPLSLITIAITLLASLVLPAHIASAQSTGSQALEIGPPVINLVGDPGQTVTAQVSLRDVSDGQLVVTSQINDFVAGDESGTPKLLLEDGEESPYSMKSWFSPISEQVLEPREVVSQDITINIPASAAPGGYYAVIRFTGVAPDLDGTGVALSASLGSLVFLRVNGDVNEDIAIEEFYTANEDSAQTLFQTAPVNFVVRLKNNGTIHEQPAGKIAVKDMFGNDVANVNVNLPPRNILPDSIRRFDQALDSRNIGNRILFGYYTADLTVTYGDGETVTAKTGFWVIPYTLIAIVVIGLILAIFLLRFLVRRYNRFIVKQAQRRR